jgi:transcriptional antiterminator RfaH
MLHWYALRAKPRREASVAALLERVGIEVYLPKTLTHRRHGQPPQSEPFFPGYCFSRLDPQRGQLRLARYTTGVLHIVGYGDEPWPVPDALIAAIQERLSHGRAAASSFQPGERVVITAGPLDEVEAIFDRHLSATGRVQVLVQILERLCRAEIPVEHLRRANQAAPLPGAAW